MTRKICVVTGGRADYGLLRWVMEDIQGRSNLQLQIIATGMHLSTKFGLTYKEIEKDGFKIDSKIEMLLDSDTAIGITKSMGLCLTSMGESLAYLRPDIVVVLGDRYEILCAVIGAMLARIPVAHLHGGEATEGLIDEAIRHSITKMAHLHFVAAEEYRQRVLQLGEQPERIFLVGGLGIDNVKRLRLLELNELEKELDFKLGAKNLLVTFHPVTLETATSAHQIDELLSALDALQDTHLIFTMPNAETDGHSIVGLIEKFCKTRVTARAYTSLGQTRYLSCMRYCDGVVGNSSSGVIEAPAFYIGTVNIGDRQRGRLKASSIIDCPPTRDAIASAISVLYSTDFQNKVKNVRNPYGEGGASEKVVEVLAGISLDGLLKKAFFNLPVPIPS